MHQPKFLKILKDILNEDNKDIHWGEDNKSIIIENKDKCMDIVKKSFNQKEFSSFSKQLNIYCFKQDKSSKEKIIYINEKYNFYKGITDEEIEYIEKDIKKEKEKKSKQNNIFDDENYKIDTNEEKINNLIKKKKLEADDMKEIFYYLKNDNKNCNFEALQKEVDLLNQLKTNYEKMYN